MRESVRKGKVFPSRLTSGGRTDTKRAREPTVNRRNSAGRNWRLRLTYYARALSRAESTGGCVKLKAVKEIDSTEQCA